MLEKLRVSSMLMSQIDPNRRFVQAQTGTPTRLREAPPEWNSSDRKKRALTMTVKVQMTAAGAIHGLPVQTK
jgi:hypothetical protein